MYSDFIAGTDRTRLDQYSSKAEIQRKFYSLVKADRDSLKSELATMPDERQQHEILSDYLTRSHIKEVITRYCLL